MKIKTLDMALANDYDNTQLDIIKKALQEDKKYRTDLLYRGFDANNITRLLSTGQDVKNEFLFCATEKQIIKSEDLDGDVFFYAWMHKKPAISVFDSREMIEHFEFAYEFKNPEQKLDALITVYKLKY